MATPLQTFTEGYDRLRGDYEFRTPDKGTIRLDQLRPVPKEYWLANKSLWWRPDLSWAVVDAALGAVDPGIVGLKIDVVFKEVSRMWEVLEPTSPLAVWDPFSWKWMVAKKIPPTGPTPGPIPEPGSDKSSQRERRRAQRDARIAEVNGIYERANPPISREVRDQRVADILDDYPDLN